METKNIGSTILARLTKREFKILELLAEGFTSKEIAEKLFISPRTVEGNRQALLVKTSTRNTIALVAFALRSEIIV